MIKIEDLWCTQRTLRLYALNQLKNIEIFSSKVNLWRTEDNKIVINNGHHRLVTFWLRGIRKITKDDYCLCEADFSFLRQDIGLKIPDLIKKYKLEENNYGKTS